MEKINQKSLIISVVILLILLVTFFIILQLISSKNSEKLLSEQQLIQEAKAHFQGMVDTRSWNAKYGGVYVKATDGLEPNPYLKNNTLLTDKNKTLIKINPAWMTRQISDISNKQGNYHFKITSLKPINPSNRADKFETQALKFFDNNPKENYFYIFNRDEKSFNFMGALPTAQACLKCHEYQGYKIGDIRGGIRVSVPLELHNEHMTLLSEKTKNSIIIVLIIAIILIAILYWFIDLLYRRKYEIEHANEILEERVKQRTYDLEVVASHELHLKDVLKIITEVNEMLITSYSTETILKNATNKLSTNGAYSLVLSGLIHGDILDIISKSSEVTNLVPQDIVSLKEQDDQNFLFDAVEKATKLKYPIIEKVSQELLCSDECRRKDELDLQWMIVLPLLHGFENDVYGMITVFCSRENGFEVEEIKILENMAHDISIALYSHKQRDSILEMEKEKSANYEETILAFVNIIEQRDTYTAGHTIRVAEYCAIIAKYMGFSDEDIHQLEKAAILHDIGKVATPDTILLKPGKLSHLEYELIQQHAEIGADMLERITIYRDLADIIRYHHSRYDGEGYPKTASPDNISMSSHIMIVADAFDAMTTNRIYRSRKSIDEALQELIDGRAEQFHPEVVDAAIIALKDINISSTSQMPTSEMEQRRMSYFFQDALTGLYNEDYLQTMLNSNNHNYRCLNIIDMKKFTKYNQTYGWEEGNSLLKRFAKFLKTSFPDAIVVRYHGDDFVILSRIHDVISSEVMSKCDIIKQNIIEIDIVHYDIDSYFNFEKFKNIEDR
ncbi:MAG: DUF3365 domain-containing protein [Campylobacterota bacterium]|nr:DUF3365 domain-containing protein [Campylobacterota bacterium]